MRIPGRPVRYHPCFPDHEGVIQLTEIALARSESSASCEQLVRDGALPVTMALSDRRDEQDNARIPTWLCPMFLQDSIEHLPLFQLFHRRQYRGPQYRHCRTWSGSLPEQT